MYKWFFECDLACKYSWLSLNGHLELVPAFLYSFYLTLYKKDTSLRRTLSAGPKGVRLRESWLYNLLSALPAARDALKRVQVEPRSNFCLRATFRTLILLFTRVRM